MDNALFSEKSAYIGIQTKLSVLLILTATFIFSVFAFYNYITLRSAMRTELHSLTNFWAKQLSESLKMPVWDYSAVSLKGIINSTMLEKQVYAVVVRGDNGNILYGRMRDSNWNIADIGQEISENEYSDKEDIVQKNEKIGMVEVRLSPRFMQQKLRDETVKMFITIIILNTALIFSLFVGVRKVIVLPVSRIVDSVRTIASGELDTSVPNGRHDEIGQLASDVESMRLAIKSLTENLKEQERLKNEMELARKIQTSLLPTLADDFHPDFEIAAAMLPADRVGGDFYDITYDRKGNLWFAIGDVSGHGVTPGLIMMMAQTVHTTVTTNIDCDARDVVVMVNEILYKNVRERLNESHFMTFTALKYLGDGRFQHAGAHLSMIVFHQKTGECELIRTKGIYLNFKKDISKGTKNSEFSLDHGDILVLYTDGLTEAETPDGTMLDIEEFVKLVEKHAHREPEAMKDMIMADVIKWCDDQRADDMTIVVIKRKAEEIFKDV
jgi:serine phosphatase RsbU (regulator of sigma subunit)